MIIVPLEVPRSVRNRREGEEERSGERREGCHNQKGMLREDKGVNRGGGNGLGKWKSRGSQPSNGTSKGTLQLWYLVSDRIVGGVR